MLIWQDITLWRDIVAKNNPDSKFNSFKVSVNVVDADKFNNPDVWPVGVA